MRLWLRNFAGFGTIQMLLLAGYVLVLGTRQATAADINITLDEAKLLKLPDRVATIVIGNPIIADASVQPGGVLVITGKGYGVTNLLVLDRTGSLLMEKTVEVRGPEKSVVVLYRGIDRETYSCTPLCERRITLGDANTYFEGLIGQIDSRTGLAQGSQSAPAEKK
jgi:hypothetical protein